MANTESLTWGEQCIDCGNYMVFHIPYVARCTVYRDGTMEFRNDSEGGLGRLPISDYLRLINDAVERAQYHYGSTFRPK